MNQEFSYQHKSLYTDAVELLRQLIATPSFSKEEDRTAALLLKFLGLKGIRAIQTANNIWALNDGFDPSKPTLLLNSHHDTVKPNLQYSKDPFQPITEEGKLFGLGSNDAGGPLVALIATFLYFHRSAELPWNIVLAATAEEEISGYNGIEALLKDDRFRKAIHYDEAEPFRDWFAIVGEPTEMQLAIAEKGLLVLDALSQGKAGHAAREEGVNAIYQAIEDINWFKTYQFEKKSLTLGLIKMSVTSIQTENKAHNVVPAECRFTVDIRVTDEYTHEALLEIIRSHVKSTVQPRSMRMRATGISLEHPLVQAGISMGKTYYGSPTCSDKALMPFAALKCGPGNSARSHTADEFIYLREIGEGIDGYIELIERAMKL